VLDAGISLEFGWLVSSSLDDFFFWFLISRWFMCIMCACEFYRRRRSLNEKLRYFHDHDVFSLQDRYSKCVVVFWLLFDRAPILGLGILYLFSFALRSRFGFFFTCGNGEWPSDGNLGPVDSDNLPLRPPTYVKPRSLEASWVLTRVVRIFSMRNQRFGCQVTGFVMSGGLGLVATRQKKASGAKTPTCLDLFLKKQVSLRDAQ
jgi:hypothetical protein